MGSLGLGYRATGGPLEMCRVLKEKAWGRMHCPESVRNPFMRQRRKVWKA